MYVSYSMIIRYTAKLETLYIYNIRWLVYGPGENLNTDDEESRFEDEEGDEESDEATSLNMFVSAPLYNL